MTSVHHIQHIAVAVKDIEQALGFWREILGLELSEVRDVPQEKSRVALLSVGESEIELVQPTTDDSSLARFIDRRGTGLHHVCLAVDDLDSLLEKLRGNGVQLVDPQPLTAAGGRRYTFIHPVSTGGVLVELYENQ